MAFGQAQGALAPALASTTNAVHRIVVVGAGIAGLSCALSCARAGAQVQVLEVSADGRSTPAHLDIVPNLLRDFASLGIADECVGRGFAYNGLAVVDEQGRHAFDIDTPHLAGEQLPAAVGIAYDEMLAILARQAVAHGASFLSGLRVDAVHADAGRVCAGGATFEADLVVLATGADSPLVASLFRPAMCSEPQTWWHALLPRPAGLNRTTWMAGELGHRVLLVPIGRSRAGLAVVRTDATAIGDSGMTLRKTLQCWGPFARRLADLLDPEGPTVMRSVAGALLDPPWHRGAVLCVGASAHAVPPPFGQAAAQGVEDALVLGELIAAGVDRASLLERFMARRGERARRVHALAERAAQWVARPEPATDLMSLGRELGAVVATPA